MELASRNALTSQEAELAISARLDRTSVEADRLLASFAPLLLFTPDGICFPYHSLGEFLAASEIRASPLSLILDYLFLPSSRHPNTSWIAAFTFLAEMRADLGSYLASHHPDFAIQACLNVHVVPERRHPWSSPINSSEAELYDLWCWHRRWRPFDMKGQNTCENMRNQR
jgi:hypothetical protein